MAGETFYTYLHGPRTFWGNSGSNIRINNNFGFPCTPPMMNGCGCNYGSSNSIWPAMMMFNSMMAQTLPLWNFGKSEGAGASDTTGTTDSLDKLTTTRRTLDQIGFTQAAGYSLLLDESGNVIYRYNNGGNEYTASSMAELTAKISARTSEATNEGTSEGTSEGAGSSDSVISVDDSASVQDTDEVEATNEEASASDDSTDTVRHSTEGAGSSTTTRKFKRGKLNKGWEWTTYAKLQNGDLKNKIADKNCKTAVDIMKAVYPNWANKSDAEIKGSSSYKLLIDANPGAINNTGKIVNKNKLDLFVRKQTTTPAATPTKTPQQKARETKLEYEKKDSYTSIIKFNGREVGSLDSDNNSNVRLELKSGKLKGSWHIKYGDGDYVDYSDVNWTGWGKYFNARRLYVGTRSKYNITSIEDFATKKTYPARYDNNNQDPQGRIEIKIDNKWIPLEDAMRM